ncbi:hypothetical protein QZM35_04995 [Burkholderia sp. AU45274]|uniref:hypothetical protein n=1 Tax=Burkholderia sp. AU45274 TaxID=3059205 RepID=UPI00265571D6|nr:hypothetical protein [Burkholderia sp. AU45274]MDN7487049.1 hypothetical protein [Burkholderia sp. AU45274]
MRAADDGPLAYRIVGTLPPACMHDRRDLSRACIRSNHGVVRSRGNGHHAAPRDARAGPVKFELAGGDSREKRQRGAMPLITA